MRSIIPIHLQANREQRVPRLELILPDFMEDTDRETVVGLVEKFAGDFALSDRAYIPVRTREGLNSLLHELDHEEDFKFTAPDGLPVNRHTLSEALFVPLKTATQSTEIDR